MGLGAVDTFVGENSQRIMNAINVLGIIVVGTLAAGKVALTTTLQIPNGDSTIAPQDTLDGFFPCLLPLLAVLGTWYLLSKKGWSATKVLCAQIVVVIVLCVIGFC